MKLKRIITLLLYQLSLPAMPLAAMVYVPGSQTSREVPYNVRQIVLGRLANAADFADAIEHITPIVVSSDYYRTDLNFTRWLLEKFKDAYHEHPIRTALALDTPAAHKIIAQWKKQKAQEVARALGISTLPNLRLISFQAGPGILLAGIIKNRNTPQQITAFITNLGMDGSLDRKWAPEISGTIRVAHTNGVVYLPPLKTSKLSFSFQLPPKHAPNQPDFFIIITSANNKKEVLGFKREN